MASLKYQHLFISLLLVSFPWSVTDDLMVKMVPHQSVFQPAQSVRGKEGEGRLCPFL